MPSHANQPTWLTNLTVFSPLGGGGSGFVLKAETAGHVVALKVARDAGAVARLQGEARALLAGASETLPALLDAFVLEDERALAVAGLTRPAPCLAMTLGAGVPLDKVWAALPPGEVPRVARAVLRDVARALAALHDAEIAHGDIKPSNILVDTAAATGSGADYRALLVDLSLNTPIDQPAPTGGTPRYLPELGGSLADAGDARSRDMWALGLCLLELLVPAARKSGSPAVLKEQLTGPLSRLVGSLLTSPALRPRAHWVAAMSSESALAQPQKDRVRRAYLHLRRAQLLRAARADSPPRVATSGLTGEWLSESAQLHRRIERLDATWTPAEPGPVELADLTAVQQRGWLLRLTGPHGVELPPLPDRQDHELAERLEAVARRKPLQALTLVDLEAPAPSDDAPSDDAPSDDARDVALALGHEAPDSVALARAEAVIARGGGTVNMAISAASALRRRNEIARAYALLKELPGEAAQLERARVLMRARDFRGAREQLLAITQAQTNVGTGRDAAALMSRVELAERNLDAAEQVLLGGPPSANWHESYAALELTRSRLEAAEKHLQAAISYPHDAEVRSRIEALRANLAQQRGDPRDALARFERAAAAAARAGALVEEATYLVGIASSAANLGRLGQSILAARRSIELFSCLERPGDSVRASLSLASALASLGAAREAHDAATAARELSPHSRDSRCEAYAHWVLADIASPELRPDHLAAAEALLKPPTADDQLRLGARRLRDAELPAGALDSLDALALADGGVDARVEWWGARACALLRPGASLSPRPVVELVKESPQAVAVDTLGEAFVFGARLAAALGDGPAENQLLRAARAAAETLVENCPKAYRASLEGRQWVGLARAGREPQIPARQLRDLETLALGLSDRGALRPLLIRILDALVLWTGVERGLLLLTAPGGKLKVRAARNVDKRDLQGHRLKLSRSLAQQALTERRPVVAMDAANELPDFHESVHALELRSVLAIPLLAKGEALGVAYLDDRVRRGAFGEDELAWVRLVATLATLALLDARQQLMLRRQVLRTERAERRLAGLLSSQTNRLEAAELELAARKSETRYRYDNIIGRSPAMLATLQLVDRVAPSELPVLVLGESGSGKELVARAIHDNSPRAGGPFVAENCSAIPETLLEATLFGHTRGAFTGATKGRPGLFELADNGTLFLDEVGEMSLGMQSKLLRVLEAGELRRLGSENPIRVDVRVICATHRDLVAAVARGEFRQDLLYRLNVVSVRVPPLRERPEDVGPLVTHFMLKYAAGKRPAVSQATIKALSRLDWPGNVRELENATRRALVLSDGELQVENFRSSAPAERSKSDGERTLRAEVRELERERIGRTLRETHGNQTRAAKRLGVSRFGLQKMIKRLGLALPQEGDEGPQ